MKIFLQIILIVILFGGGIYFGQMIQEGVGYMRSMSNHTVRMSKTMDSLSADIKSMTQQIEGMHSGITDIDKHISMMSADTKNMSVQTFGMHSETAEIDKHISKMNADMSRIQSAMSADLNSMRQGVDSMSYDVRYMRDSLVQMSTDIRRGSEAFSSPPDYFRNMFDYGR